MLNIKLMFKVLHHAMAMFRSIALLHVSLWGRIDYIYTLFFCKACKIQDPIPKNILINMYIHYIYIYICLYHK